jgi:phosphate uptake regulator
MLKKIRALWKDDSLMGEVVQTLGNMVSDAEYVYTHAWEACTGQAVIEATKGPLAQHDKAVNRGEREIRRKVVEHLTINPGQDASGCMAVMIMAKDIERIGDHGRNIFNVAARITCDIPEFMIFDRLAAVHGRIGELLPDLNRAILDSDEVLTHDILRRYTENKQEAKKLIGSLPDLDVPGREAVASTLLCRFHVRVNAHIGNAASGVIFPVENIDFVSRGLKREEKDI